MGKKSGLGRGLSALIPVTKEVEHPGDRYEEVLIEKLEANPEQPRHHFHEQKLAELSDSIKHNGVIQPIIVTAKGDKFIVIAGERRWRATKLAGYDKIPAVIRKVDDKQMLSLALLENIQRQELNPIEEALAYRRLLDVNNFTHDTLASRMGKSRVTISNTVRLLKLPDSIKNFIQDEKITFGHARCLVAIDDEEKVNKLAEQCIEKQWSVRELEKRIQQEREERKDRSKIKKDPAIMETEKVLSGALGTKVSIAGNDKKGKIVFTYGSNDVFQRIIDTFMERDDRSENEENG